MTSVDFEPEFETERRFLVRDTSVVVGASFELITQAYLFVADGYAVRVRQTQQVDVDGSTISGPASLTAKGPRFGAKREEYNREVSALWAEQVIARSANVVRKRRFHLVTDQTWDVDEFLDENEGLWIAELEGGDEIRTVPRPDWAGLEIKHDPRFNNESLALSPYLTWPAEERENLR